MLSYEGIEVFVEGIKWISEKVFFIEGIVNLAFWKLSVFNA